MTQGIASGRRAVATAFGGRRGTARLAVLVAAVGVLAGLTLGHGVAAHAAKSGYNLAWIPDSKRGEVVQVDPVRGKANVRLQVAGAGADLDVQQTNGQLVIIDHHTGKVSSVNLGTLLTSGTRATPAGARVKVLVAGSSMYLADLDAGTVQAVDPSTEANIGTPWSAGGSLVDVGIDGKHRVWALDAQQQLVTLEWHGSTLVPVERHALTGTGPGSVIISHDQGVTVVGSQGTISRVGTGNDSTISSGAVAGTLAAPASSPSDLVPVADKSNSSVTIIGSGGAVNSPTAGLGCSEPGGPVVFDGKVYVPCLGAGSVIVLDSHGNEVRSPIHTPGGGDPQLTVSSGHLIISAAGSSVAIVIDTVGDARPVQTIDPTVPVQDPQHTPATTPPDPPNPAAGLHPRHTGNHNGNHGSNDQGGSHGSSTGGSSTGAVDPTQGVGTTGSTGDGTGSNGGAGTASATARPDGTVLVSWNGPDAEGGYQITGGSDGAMLATASAGASSATVTTLNPGSTTALTVTALDGHQRELWSATTGSVTVTGQGLSVSHIRYTPTQTTGGTSLAISWNAAPTTDAVTYDVTATHAAPVDAVTGTSTTLTAQCTATCRGTITVTPRTDQGVGSTTTISYSGAVGSGQSPTSAPPATAPPAQPTTAAPAPVQPTTAAPAPAPTTAPAPDPTTAPAPTPAPTQPAPMPAGGETMVTGHATPGNDNTGTDATVTITVNAPPDWAAWTGGTCTIIDTDYDTGVEVPCGAQNWTQEFDYEASGSHTFQVRATATDGRIADSAGYTVFVRYTYSTCGGQNRNFVNGPGSLPACQIPFTGATTHHTVRLTTVPAQFDTDTQRTYLHATAAPHSSHGDTAPWLAGGLLVALALGTSGGVAVRRRRVAP